MTKIAYTVRATIPNGSTRDVFVDWLTTGGHVAEVIAGGASSGDVCVLDRGANDPIVVEIRYTFPDRPTFDAYERDHAPRLRQEGIEKFGDSGITFERSVGEIVNR